MFPVSQETPNEASVDESAKTKRKRVRKRKKKLDNGATIEQTTENEQSVASRSETSTMKSFERISKENIHIRLVHEMKDIFV